MVLDHGTLVGGELPSEPKQSEPYLGHRRDQALG
jgi:hypothetical protein